MVAGSAKDVTGEPPIPPAPGVHRGWAPYLRARRVAWP